jgi:DNA polymerase III epsilon subunit-like protein
MRKIIFDYEAENLNLALCRPWQLAWRIEEKGKETIRKERWIDIHDLNVSEGAAKVTGFTYDKWHAKKVPAKQVVDEIEADFFDDPDTTFVAHNGMGYDIYIKGNLYSYVGRKFDPKRMVLKFRDTLSMARARALELTPPPFGTPEFALFQYRMLAAHQKGMKVTLSALCEEFNVPFDRAKTHDALYDVDLNAIIDNKLIYALDLS